MKDSPEWQRLEQLLGALAEECGAHGAHVLDSRANLWCAGPGLYDSPESSAVMDRVEAHLAALPLSIHRGGTLDKVGGDLYMKSFAGIYVLALGFREPIEEAPVRATVLTYLPRVEVRTLRLPPPQDPGSSSPGSFGVA